MPVLMPLLLLSKPTRHERFTGLTGCSAAVRGVPRGCKPSQSHAKSDKGTPPPFSLRLTFEERARLEREAGDMPLGTYIRFKLSDKPASDRPTRKATRPAKDHQVPASVLGGTPPKAPQEAFTPRQKQRDIDYTPER
ncbi:MAG: hypothetical protein P0119_06315 [Nitrospira sp.]|nr:hypothetical protein [Nitrospira sp.]